MGLHRNLAQADNHVAHSLSFADAAARTAFSAVAADVGRIAIQLDTLAFYILTDDSPLTWVALGGSSSTSKAVLGWGSSNVTSSTTTRYLHPWYEDSIAPTAVIQIRVPFAGTLRNFRVRQGTGAGNGNNIVYTVRKNGTAGAIVATLASTANDGSDLSNTITVAAGDLVDIEVTKAASVTTSPSDITATLELDAA